MPHIIVEYSSNLHAEVQETKLLQHLHQVVVASDLFSPEAVKARGISVDDYVLPESAHSFMHITIAILTGRTVQERQRLGQSSFETAKKTMSPIDKLSVDIREMTKETYSK